MLLGLAARDFGNYYENMGLLVRTQLVDRDIALNLWSRTAVEAWKGLEPFIALIREARGAAVWENFEYFVVLSQDWLATHSKGDYPPGLRASIPRTSGLKPTNSMQPPELPRLPLHLGNYCTAPLTVSEIAPLTRRPL